MVTENQEKIRERNILFIEKVLNGSKKYFLKSISKKKLKKLEKNLIMYLSIT